MHIHCSEQQKILDLLEQDPHDETLLTELEHHLETCSQCHEGEAKLQDLWHMYKVSSTPLPAALEQRLSICMEQKSA